MFNDNNISGLVYATVFGSAFATASAKLFDLQAKFVSEVSMLDQIYTLTSKLDLSREQKMKICKVGNYVHNLSPHLRRRILSLYPILVS